MPRSLPGFAMIRRSFIFCLVLLAGLQPALARDGQSPDLASARSLLMSGKAEAAWVLLAPHEPELAGDEGFDYLLGVAALESGRHGRASFILERVVNVSPGHAAAQLDLGRAYFALGDFDRARQQFEATLRQDPPPGARTTAESHLAAMEPQNRAGGLRTTGYLEAGVGTDDNVNAGVSGGSYLMPILNLSLSSQARRVDHETFAAGVETSLSLNAKSDVFGGIDLKRRQNGHRTVDSTRNADYYNTRSADGRLGVQHKIDAANVLRLTASRMRLTLDDTQGYRRSQSLLAEWRHAFDATTQGSLWLLDQRSRYGTVRTTSYRQYGGDQLLAGFGLVRGFGQGNTVIAHLTAYGGSERATDRASGNLDGDKTLTGARIGGQVRVLPELDLTASLGGSLTRYELYNLLFYTHRRDHVWDAALGAQWRLNKEWTVKPQYAYTRSDSNIGAYDHERHDYSITLRYDFR